MIGYGLSQIPSAVEGCRYIEAYGPHPLKQLPRPSENGGSGSTFESVSRDQIAKLRAENPDWDINLVQEQEPQSKDWKGSPHYHFDGHYVGTLHWRSWWEIFYSSVTGSVVGLVGWMFAGALLIALVILSKRVRRRATV